MMESHHTSFTISSSKVKNFIEDIPKLVQLEPKGLCGIEQYIGTLMHYVTASNDYLGNQEKDVEFDLAYYRSKDLWLLDFMKTFLKRLNKLIFKIWRATTLGVIIGTWHLKEFSRSRNGLLMIYLALMAQ